MVETITPVVHGGRRGSYLTSILLHTFGATLAAVVFGAALGAIGALVNAPWGNTGAIAIGLVSAVYLLREALNLPVPIPDRHKQVPEWWRTFYPPPVASLLYGLGLGIGFFTFLTFGTYVAVTVGALASGDVGQGILICAPFGLARGLSVLVGARGEGASPLDDLAATPWPRAANALALSAVAAVALLGL
jgi:hypothetical protein